MADKRASVMSGETLVTGPLAERPTIISGEKGGLGYYGKPRGPKTELLERALYPSDVYKGKTYWADLTGSERRSFLREQAAQESAREWSLLWQDFQKDPMLPFIHYWNNYVLPGMGLFTEGYTLFSIGRLKSLFSAAYPSCWKTFTSCNKVTTETTDYLQVVGIIIGQISVGIESDWVGRRFGLIQDAAIMLAGGILLTGMWGVTLQGWIACYMVAQLVYGIGVGGEYPMTATLSMERASGANANAADRLHRGRRVVGAFLMQGWGQFLNTGVLIILLLIFNRHGGKPYSTAAAGATFRVSFALVTVLIIWLLYYRIWRLKTADDALRKAKKRGGVSGYDAESLRLAFTHYWHRLIATALGWFANDFAFYGSSIFATEFIAILSPNPSVQTTWLWNLLGVGIGLVGYYAAWATIDSKFWGRRRMQMLGFLLNFILYTIAGFAWETLTGSKPGLHGLQFIYLFTSFWQQFGPNCVTFLVAAEIYPAPIRGSAHGFSAAIGKLGALTPNVAYNYLSNENKFRVACWFALLGFLVTLIFLPDVTGLDLREQERRWKYTKDGKGKEYRGVAVHRQHLSLYEIYVLKQHLQYNAEVDAKARIREWEETFKKEQQEFAGEKGGDWDEHSSDLSSDVFHYFKSKNESSETLVPKPSKKKVVPK